MLQLARAQGFESLRFLQMYDYNKLYPTFEALFIELLVILHGRTARSLMEDMEFFIMEPSMSPTCRTNISLAYRFGLEVANARGSDAIAVGALWSLFLARDGMLKGFPLIEVEDLLRNAKNAIK